MFATEERLCVRTSDDWAKHYWYKKAKGIHQKADFSIFGGKAMFVSGLNGGL